MIIFKKLTFFSVTLYILTYLFLFLFVYSLTGTRNIAIAMCIAALIIPIQVERSRSAKVSQELEKSWPEVIDHIVSGLQSGLSLSECIMTLSMRGPAVSRKIFSEIANLHVNGMNFSDVMNQLKVRSNSAEADLISESLIIARKLGGRDIGIVLRLLGEYFRDNVALREEIKAKQSWIKNSAVLASLAPWLLLMILSTQASTRATYSTASGMLVLMCGAGITLIAFIWMNVVGRIPEPPRLFADKRLKARELEIL